MRETADKLIRRIKRTTPSGKEFARIVGDAALKVVTGELKPKGAEPVIRAAREQLRTFRGVKSI